MKIYGQTIARTDVVIGEASQPNQDAFGIGDCWGAVFDGLGGHSGSEHASALAEHTLSQFVTDSQTQWSVLAMEAARAALVAARKAGPFADMTCAGAVAHACGNVVDFAWTGDVRVYLFSQNKLTRLSDDHDILYHATITGRGLPVATARRLRDIVANAHTASEAWRGGGGLTKKAFKKNHLMFSDLSSGEISHGTIAAKSGDLVLITCDGIHDNYVEVDMQQDLQGVTTAQAAVQTLIEGAIAIANQPEQYPRGHSDDITCVAFEF